jgi:hypothetical protein
MLAHPGLRTSWQAETLSIITSILSTTSSREISSSRHNSQVASRALKAQDHLLQGPSKSSISITQHLWLGFHKISQELDRQPLKLSKKSSTSKF